jgi:hypothetical protein
MPEEVPVISVKQALTSLFHKVRKKGPLSIAFAGGARVSPPGQVNLRNQDDEYTTNSAGGIPTGRICQNVYSAPDRCGFSPTPCRFISPFARCRPGSARTLPGELGKEGA